jgi:predicted small metal-binding protein
MKSFACGDVVPGCEARWVCSDEQEVLREVAQHAAAAHGLTQVPDDVVAAVRGAIVDVPA